MSRILMVTPVRAVPRRHRRVRGATGEGVAARRQRGRGALARAVGRAPVARPSQSEGPGGARTASEPVRSARDPVPPRCLPPHRCVGARPRGEHGRAHGRVPPRARERDGRPRVRRRAPSIRPAQPRLDRSHVALGRSARCSTRRSSATGSSPCGRCRMSGPRSWHTVPASCRTRTPTALRLGRSWASLSIGSCSWRSGSSSPTRASIGRSRRSQRAGPRRWARSCTSSDRCVSTSRRSCSIGTSSRPRSARPEVRRSTTPI